MAGQARHTGIDDGGDAVDGDRAFRHVGGQNHLGGGRWRDGTVLLLGRLVAVQGKHAPTLPARDGGASSLGAADLARPGQKHKHVPGVPASGEPLQRARDPFLDGRGRVRRVLDFKRVLAPFAANHARTAQIRGDRRGIERRRHHHDAEVGPRGALEADQKGEREVAFEVALVEFVQHDTAGALQLRVAHEAAREHAFGKKAQASSGPGDFLEADLVADGRTHALAELAGDEAGGKAGGKAAGLQHQHLA